MKRTPDVHCVRRRALPAQKQVQASGEKRAHGPLRISCTGERAIQEKFCTHLRAILLTHGNKDIAGAADIWREQTLPPLTFYADWETDQGNLTEMPARLSSTRVSDPAGSHQWTIDMIAEHMVANRVCWLAGMDGWARAALILAPVAHRDPANQAYQPPQAVIELLSGRHDFPDPYVPLHLHRFSAKQNRAYLENGQCAVDCLAYL